MIAQISERIGTGMAKFITTEVNIVAILNLFLYN